MRGHSRHGHLRDELERSKRDGWVVHRSNGPHIVTHHALQNRANALADPTHRAGIGRGAKGAEGAVREDDPG